MIIMKENEQLRKIQKLLALANDANDEESQAALAKAQELMLEQKISEEDILQYQEEKRLDLVIEKVIYSGKPQKWLYRLYQIIAKNFRVQAFYTEKMPIQLVFLGIERDVLVAEVTFVYAMASVQYGARTFMQRPEIKRKRKRKWEMKQDYIEGYLQALASLFREQVLTNGYEVALQLPEIVIDALKSKNLQPGKNRERKIQDVEAYREGYTDGKQFRKKMAIKNGQE